MISQWYRVLTVFAVFMLLTAVGNAQIPGGRKQIPVNDAGVVQVAQFAVQAHGKTTSDDSLKLLKIIDAQRQVVQGFSYTLTLNVKSGDQTKRAEAVVWVKPVLKDQKEEDRTQLTSWKWK